LAVLPRTPKQHFKGHPGRGPASGTLNEERKKLNTNKGPGGKRMSAESGEIVGGPYELNAWKEDKSRGGTDKDELQGKKSLARGDKWGKGAPQSTRQS